MHGTALALSAHMRFVAARPFVLIGPGIVAGCLVGADGAASRLAVHAAVLLAAAIVTAMLCVLRAPVLARLAALLATAIQLGLVLTEWAESRALERRAGLEGIRDPVVIEGIVVSQPRAIGPPRAPPWAEPSGRAESRCIAVEVCVDRVDGAPADFRAVVYIEDAETPALGGRIRLRGRVRLPEAPGNPGEADARRWAMASGIDATIWPAKGGSVVVRPPPAVLPPSIWPERLRAALRARLDGACRPEVAALLAALMLGDRGDVDVELQDRLRKSGASHVLAISGLHVSMILPVVWGLLHVGGMRLARRAWCVVGVAVAFAVLTGLQPPVVRCIVMAVALSLAPLARRRADPANTLGMAAALIAACDPLVAPLPGFQLTFAAVVGIMAFYKPLADRMAGMLPLRRLSRMLAGSVAVSVAAWLPTYPLTLIHFNMVSGASCVSSLFIIPLVFVDLMLGALILLTGFSWLGSLAGIAYDAMNLAAWGCAELPFAWTYAPAPPWPVWLLYGAGCIAARWSGRLWPLVGVVFLPVLLVDRSSVPDGTVVVHMLDVRRGASVLLEFPDGSVVLYDAGSLNSGAPEHRWIAPALWEKGIRRIDALILSHPDRDHTNGTAGLIERFEVGAVWVGRPFVETGEGAAVVRYVESRGVRVRIVEPDPALPLSVNEWMTLMPPAPWTALGRATVPTNEASLIAEVGVGGRRILLTGDAGPWGCGYLMLQDGRTADVLVVPHHGKRNAQMDRLIGVLRPQVALVPAPVGYSAPEVLDGLRRSGAAVYSTGECGAVEVLVSAGGVDVRCFRAKKE